MMDSIEYGPLHTGFIRQKQTEYLATLAKDIFWDPETKELLLGRSKFPLQCQVHRNQSGYIRVLSDKRTYSITKSIDGTIWLGHHDGLGSINNGIYHL